MHRGFTLLEVVISIAVVLVLTFFLAGAASAIRLVRSAQHEDVALRVAESEIAALRAGGYDNVPVSGTFSDSLLSDLPQGAGALVTSDYNDSTKQIVTTVSWQDPGMNTQSVTLTTLVTKTGGL